MYHHMSRRLVGIKLRYSGKHTCVISKLQEMHEKRVKRGLILQDTKVHM